MDLEVRRRIVQIASAVSAHLLMLGTDLKKMTSSTNYSLRLCALQSPCGVIYSQDNEQRRLFRAA